jgi:hypothetical protein
MKLSDRREELMRFHEALGRFAAKLPSDAAGTGSTFRSQAEFSFDSGDIARYPEKPGVVSHTETERLRERVGIMMEVAP